LQVAPTHSRLGTVSKRELDNAREGALQPTVVRRPEEPPMFQVVLHNDDFTTQEFVVHVLKHVFHHGEAEAARIMLSVHHNGRGVAGIYPFEIAESKAAQVTRLARQSEYPLRCSVETHR